MCWDFNVRNEGHFVLYNKQIGYGRFAVHIDAFDAYSFCREMSHYCMLVMVSMAKLNCVDSMAHRDTNSSIAYVLTTWDI